MQPRLTTPSAPTMRLCLKSTFIDLESTLREAESSPRCRSDPGVYWKPSESFFVDQEHREEAAYVQALEGKVKDAWWGSFRGGRVGIGGEDHTPGGCADGGKYGDEDEMFGELSTSAGTFASASLETLPPVAEPEEPLAATAPATASSSLETLPPVFEVEEPPVAEVPRPPRPRNPGSVGHPDLCKRPCRFFAQGFCASGDSCDFCHVPHSHQDPCLDKKNRVVLHAMSPGMRLAVLATAMKEAASRLPNSIGAVEAVEAWALSAGVPHMEGKFAEQKGLGVKPSDARRLLMYMRSLSFTNLCNLSRSFPECLSLSGPLSELLGQLRAAAESSNH